MTSDSLLPTATGIQLNHTEIILCTYKSFSSGPALASLGRFTSMRKLFAGDQSHARFIGADYNTEDSILDVDF